MKHTRSADGTEIAYDAIGAGPALVIVGGAFSYRTFPLLQQLATLLAESHTVFTYDRRGRGDSGDAKPYSIEKEIQDLEAVIDVADSPVDVWGLSSGAILAMKAAAAGAPIRRLAVYEPPFIVDDSHVPLDAAFASMIDGLVQGGENRKAVKEFMTTGMGAPAAFVSVMQALNPGWKHLPAMANTIPYELALLGKDGLGNPLNASDWSTITVPTLVQRGAKSPKSLRSAAAATAVTVPGAILQTLPGQNHILKPRLVAPYLLTYFK